MNNTNGNVIHVRTTAPLDSGYTIRPRIPRDLWLRDGSEMRLRELKLDDREKLKDFFSRCSRESIRFRFLHPIHEVSDPLIDYLLNVDGSRRVALILTQKEGEEERIVAEGRYATYDKQPHKADLAFLVLDRLQRRGIATLLLKELGEIACRNGVTHLTGDVAAENRAMLGLIRKTDQARIGNISYGVIHFEIPSACGERGTMLFAA